MGEMPRGGRHRFALALLLPLAGCGEDRLPDHLAMPGADPARGLALIQDYGCGTCHTIAGVRGARGQVGPLLEAYGGRKLLAGFLSNTPTNLTAYLVDPPSIDPRTGMPAMGIGAGEARDIAAFLYAQGGGRTPVYPQDRPLDIETPPRPETLPARGPFVGRPPQG